MNRKLTAGLMIAAAVLTNVAFTALRVVFDSPMVLKRPVEDLLTSFREHEQAVSVWFFVLAVAAALFAPIALGVGRLSERRAMRLATPIGVAAAVVQVIGLSRWPALVPRFAQDAASADASVVAAAHDHFETAQLWLGQIVEQSAGYLLTSVWTALVVIALHQSVAGRWFSLVGAAAALLILVGVLAPLDLPAVESANFAGFVIWSDWLVVLAVLLLRRPHHGAARSHGEGLRSATKPSTEGATHV